MRLIPLVCDEVCTAVMAFDWGAANRKEKLLFFGLGGRVLCAVNNVWLRFDATPEIKTTIKTKDCHCPTFSFSGSSCRTSFVCDLLWLRLAAASRS